MLVNKAYLKIHYYLVSQNFFFLFLFFFFWIHHLETFESRRGCKRVTECHSHHINYLLQSSQQSHEQEGYYSSHLTGVDKAQRN